MLDWNYGTLARSPLGRYSQIVTFRHSISLLLTFAHIIYLDLTHVSALLQHALLQLLILHSVSTPAIHTHLGRKHLSTHTLSYTRRLPRLRVLG